MPKLSKTESFSSSGGNFIEKCGFTCKKFVAILFTVYFILLFFWFVSSPSLLKKAWVVLRASARNLACWAEVGLAEALCWAAAEDMMWDAPVRGGGPVCCWGAVTCRPSNTIIFFAFLVKKTSGILLFYIYIYNIPEVLSTKKAKNMNHRSPLFPTIYDNM